MSYPQQGKALLGEAYDSGGAIATAVALPSSNWGFASESTDNFAPSSSGAFTPGNNGMYAPTNGGGGIGQDFFLTYADVVKQIDSLSYVERAIADVDGKISNSKKVIEDCRHKLSKANVDQPKLEARIHRNENPHFFHYMQVGRKEKVVKLKGDLENLLRWQERWASEKLQAETILAQQLEEMSKLQNSAGSKAQLSSKRNQMYEQAVTSVPPTARLQQIDMNTQSQLGNLQLEQGILQQVDSCMNLVQRSLELYNRSMQMLQQAAQANQTAQVVNTFDMMDGRRGGPQYFETMNQAQRDRLINESQGPAVQAYQVISQAWQVFPDAARQRYPSMAAQIGHAPLPQLRGANFGNTLMTGMVFGDIGDMVNNNRATGKIQENMGIISQCIQIMTQQMSYVQALRNAIATNVSQMEGQVNTLNHQRKEERDQIFENVKRTALMGMQGNYPPATFAVNTSGYNPPPAMF